MSEFTKVEGRQIGDIKIYALSTCGWCKKTKRFFNDNHIAYSYIDVDMLPPKEADTAVAEQMKYNPHGSFPTIVIDSKRCIIGFNEAELLELIGA